MSREFIFSNNDIQELLKSFIPVALNTYGLQHENKTTVAEAREFFFKIADQTDLYKGVPKQFLGNPRFPYHPTKSPDGTAQGFYVCSGDGDLQFATWGLLANFGHAKLLNQLKKLKPTDGANAKSVEVVDDITTVAPENVQIISVFARLGMLDTTKKLPDGILERGRDLLWVTDEEIDQLSKGQFPNTLRTRIVLFHLVDTTPGVPTGWGAGDVKVATFSATPTKTTDGTSISVSGEFEINKPDNSSGYKGKLEGKLMVKDAKLVTFKMVAEGKAWRPREDNWPPKDGYSMKIGFVKSTSPIDAKILPVVATFGESHEAYLEFEIPN